MMAIRQAFHTLKGSGRMAAQERIGDAASSVEQCFNYWLAQERAANADLILLTCFARDQMAAWIGALRSDPAAAVDCSDVAATAERVRKGEPFTVRGLGGADRNDTDLPEFEFEETSEPADASTGEVKQIGPVILDRREYVEFLNDADEHIRTVSQDFSEWRFEQRPPSQAALHCCHLLAQAVARIGLAPVTAIAAPLDVLLQALAEHGGAQQPLDSIQFDVLEGAVTRMRGMLHQFAADIYPSAAPVDADAVRALLGSVQAQGARPSPAAAPHDEAVSDIESSLDPELQRIFAMEGSDLLREIGAGLRTLVARPDDEDTAQQVLRLLHTAKGSARMAGAMQLGEVLHTMEARLQGAAESRETPKQAIEALQAALDEAMVLFERVTAPPPAAAGATAADGAIPSLPSTMNGPEAAHPVAETVGAASSFIRVRTDLLDRLVDHIGEFSITRAKMDSQIGAVHTALGELSQSLQRLRAQMRDLEIQADAQIQAHSDQMSRAPAAFDPLEHDRYTGLQELTRMLRETIEDVSAVQSGMSKSLQAAESDLAAQGRLSREIHQEFLRVRLVTFEQVAERLHHVVRQTARETGKQVQLTLRGESTEIDRGVLEKMAGPFEHLLRNAVVHGIEAPEARLAAGKPEGGEIRIDVSQQAGEIVVTIADDGAGLDVEAVRRRAIESGLVAADQPFGQRDAIGLIFAPGFTTVREATKLAGRGVGLDAVHSELSSFGGRIAISSERDRGMRFTLHLPPTLTVMQALLALVGDRHYAIPAGIVERVVRLDRDVLSRQIKEGALSDAQAGQIVLRPLAQLLGGKVALTRARQMPVLILRSDADRLAIAVDDISIQQEVIVKKIGSAARLSGMLGATIIGSGEIVLIVDPMQLITRAPEPPLLTEFAASDGRSTEAGTTPDDLPPRIMIVDDSMTVRRVTQRLLERNGMIASEARNGVEALQRIAAEDPDLMLVDIEMPHMDGFELLRKLREEPATQALPVIMITSRIGDKHRRLAAELGANEYLGKPYQDDELLRLIHRHLPAEHAGQ
jgi:chemosensory pili system protein ChpA (sensor histidine kinase/response regulator)